MAGGGVGYRVMRERYRHGVLRDRSWHFPGLQGMDACGGCSSFPLWGEYSDEEKNWGVVRLR
eukprot:4474443-Alexandrium_andersonii.AAC.1